MWDTGLQGQRCPDCGEKQAWMSFLSSPCRCQVCSPGRMDSPDNRQGTVTPKPELVVRMQEKSLGFCLYAVVLAMEIG